MAFSVTQEAAKGGKGGDDLKSYSNKKRLVSPCSKTMSCTCFDTISSLLVDPNIYGRR